MPDEHQNTSDPFDVDQLVSIRCPKKRWFPEYKTLMVCNNKCSEVLPGSKGRAWCWRCRRAGQNPFFWFDVDKDYKKPTKPVKVVRSKKVI